MLLATLVVSCSRSDFEQEAQTKKLNALRRAQVTPAEWNELHTGKRVYEDYCAGCHGKKGDGKGPAAAMLDVKPRNFTRAMFKFISTPGGSLPTDNDLHATLLRGVPRSSMPSWALLPEAELRAVVQYIKTFSDRWQSTDKEQPLTFGEPPVWVAGRASIATGKVVYQRMGCANCHGELGHGDGPSSPTLKDAEGNPIKPFNFTEGILKGGSTAKDIYRAFYTGLAGTPMPSYGGVVSDAENWHLVSYALYLMGKTKWSQHDIDSFTPLSDDSARSMTAPDHTVSASNTSSAAVANARIVDDAPFQR